MTSTVSGRIARRISSGSTKPKRSTGSSVTWAPSRSTNRSGSRIAGCSIWVLMKWAFRRRSARVWRSRSRNRCRRRRPARRARQRAGAGGGASSRDRIQHDLPPDLTAGVADRVDHHVSGVVAHPAQHVLHRGPPPELAAARLDRLRSRDVCGRRGLSLPDRSLSQSIPQTEKDSEKAERAAGVMRRNRASRDAQTACV